MPVIGLGPSGVAAGPTTLASDDFNRADNAVDMGATSVGGLLWSAFGQAWGIIGNQAYSATFGAAHSGAFVFAGAADVTVKATLTTLPPTYAPGLTGRYTDPSNLWSVTASPAGGTYNLEKVVAGAASSLGTGGVTANGDVVELVMSGNSISVKVNGAVVIGPVTDSFNATAQRHGLALSAGGAAPTFRIDNLFITTP